MFTFVRRCPLLAMHLVDHVSQACDLTVHVGHESLHFFCLGELGATLKAKICSNFCYLFSQNPLHTGFTRGHAFALCCLEFSSKGSIFGLV